MSYGNWWGRCALIAVLLRPSQDMPELAASVPVRALLPQMTTAIAFSIELVVGCSDSGPGSVGIYSRASARLFYPFTLMIHQFTMNDGVLRG